ncbi:MAG: GspE/PulE family protein [Candidatus Gracilibacteria bacterium]|jgi:type IV pilus assembly protein PilB|nr:GspE/PulE family protein [Candidatus Gracilibacteria bacterium]
MMNKESLVKLQEAILAGNIPQIVKSILQLALEMGTSDIHIEPGEHSVRNRFRVDGELREIIEYPRNIHPAVVSRIKIMANLKIDEQRRPQDGRLQMTTDDRKEMELRVSTLPTVGGEKICMRLQDKNKSIPNFEQLGLTGHNRRALDEVIKNPNQIMLVTGPTGSGKTTTLYSVLACLNKPNINIMTIEDPVEYGMAGLSQSQVKPDIGYTFADGLRCALRQDPDIIMVGEIRDQETIEIAIKAALTGHMVLSTIHTNSAAATVTRIVDMGIPPFKITSAVSTIEAQRLARRICPNCKEEYKPDGKIQEDIYNKLKNVDPSEFDKSKLDNLVLYRGKGCPECDGTGSRGRMGIYEIMRFDRDIEKLILAGAHDYEIEECSVSKGMVTLNQWALIHAVNGAITIEETYKS